MCLLTTLMSSLRQTGIEWHMAYLEPKNKPQKALINRSPRAGVIGEALPAASLHLLGTEFW